MKTPQLNDAVLFTAGASADHLTSGEQYPATIAHVWSDTAVALHVDGPDGASHSETSVPLWRAESGEPKPDVYFAEYPAK